ncbi:MAG TPA: tetratricopeptide repeat protein [Burkholderiales bacterium]|nr:tetratricopeptide repeat protein [Burkholderiales bacterium]
MSHRSRVTACAFASLVASLCVAGTALAQDAHAGHAPDQVGKVHFANSCSKAAQADLGRGMAMLHSFWYSAGEKAFSDALAADPGCAIADWGIASLLMLNPLNGNGPPPKNAERAQALLAQARGIGAKTQRERDYIEALAAYYQDWAAKPERARQDARSKAYEALAARYPTDDEAQIFSALYIACTQRADDQTYAAYSKAAAILEKQFAKYPRHPGVAHYLIHSYDAPPLAQQGLKAARLYATLAPDAPHALHMPSHIFTRVGAWEESAATNRRAYAAALRGNEFAEAYHASDYAVYGYLQVGRDEAALSAMQEVMKVTVAAPVPPATWYATAAMPARYALERGDWSGAAQLAMPPGKLPYAEGITLFARTIGAARSGDVAAAEANAAELALRHQKLIEAKNAYWATEVEVQQRAAAGWIAFARGNRGEGIALMRAAADIEDKNEKSIVTPGRVLPARELLGDMLMQAGQPAQALQEYETSQLREPNRLRAYNGAAHAAEALGQRDKAKTYYAKLVAQTPNAEPLRPEVVRARAYVAQ